MDNIKKYSDRFIKEHYDSICLKFKALNKKVSDSSCYDAMDKMHDVMLSLYDAKGFGNYQDFEAWAMRKFTEKEKR